MKKEATIKVNIGLKEHLDEKSIAKLQRMKQDWVNQEQAQKEEKEKRLAEARKQQERNKTFADLFEESNLDWRSFK